MASAAEIANYAYTAGWRSKDLTVAIAVALAESGGNEGNIGDKDLANDEWGPSVGLWQIRSKNAEKGKGSLRDETANLDPLTNARHAYEIWKQSGWKPWSVHNNNKYLMYMPTAAAVAGSATIVQGASSVVAPITDVPKAILTAASEPIRVLKWLQSSGTQLRIAKFVIGIGLVLSGMYIIAQKPVQQVATKVTRVVTK